MGLRKQHFIAKEMHSPTRQDRLIVLLMTVGMFLLLLPLARNIHPQIVGWIVMAIVIGLPVVTINVLLPFSLWEQLPSEEESCQDHGELHEKEREHARSA
jgi:hypothetical protein